ncbi:MAG: protease inhibitor I42 family protein [Thermodesulfovibrionales bacterium]
MHETHADGGYIWEVVSGAESILQQGEELCTLDSSCTPQSAGCSLMCTFTFKAIAPGHVPLKLIEHRPWEKGVAPLQVFEVTAIVNAVPIPTLTEWGMIVFAVFAGLSSAYCLMRREMPPQ